MKKAFYTAIFSEINPIDNPKTFLKIPEWDYILFTNLDFKKFSTSWSIITINKPFDCNIMSARMIKWSGHDLLKDYDILIWLDGFLHPRVENQVQWENYLLQLNSYDILFKKHPLRDCIYDESIAVIRYHKDKAERVAINQKVFEINQMPKKWGLMETNIIIYKNNISTRELLHKVFVFLQDKSYRDQLALTYILWKNQYNNYKIINHSDISEIVEGQAKNHIYVNDKILRKEIRMQKRRQKTAQRRLEMKNSLTRVCLNKVESSD